MLMMWGFLDKSFLNWLFIFSAIILVKAPEIIRSQQDAQSTSEDLTRFKIDTARLTIIKEGNHQHSLNILSLSDNCYNCAYYSVGNVTSHNKTLLVDTRWRTSIYLKSSIENCSAKWTYFYGERGEYWINFTANSFMNNSCSISGIKIHVHPENSYIPILVAFLILLSLALLYTIGCWLYKTKGSSLSTTALVTNDLGDPNPVNNPDETPGEIRPHQRRERLKSIDTFRGLCIVIMIFVNYKGGYYWFFRHSAWNGLTVADLVFPWFMFIMGVNITLSVESLLKRNTPRGQIAYKVIRRTLILFALGLTAINHNTTWTSLRVPGVLQRFAIAYLFAFLIQWAFHKSPAELHQKASIDDETLTWWYGIRDILLYWPQWIIVIAMEILWLTLTFLLPVPGCPTGYIGPGGLADDGKYINETCVGGAAGHIDRWMFGKDHMYGHPTAKAVYYPMFGDDQKVPFDPEGVLGSINGCLIVFLGSQMGKIFLYYETPKARTIRWLSWSFVLGVISIILCKASANEGWIPVNKNLWSTTFITTLSCMAFFLITLIYYVVDVYKVLSGSPLDFVGMNSIFLYVGHEVFHDYLPFRWGATQYSSHAEYLAMNMLGVSYWVIIAYYCYKIKFFVKI